MRGAVHRAVSSARVCRRGELAGEYWADSAAPRGPCRLRSHEPFASLRDATNGGLSQRRSAVRGAPPRGAHRRCRAIGAWSRSRSLSALGRRSCLGPRSCPIPMWVQGFISLGWTGAGASLAMRVKNTWKILRCTHPFSQRFEARTRLVLVTDSSSCELGARRRTRTGGPAHRGR